MIFEITK